MKEGYYYWMCAGSSPGWQQAMGTEEEEVKNEIEKIYGKLPDNTFIAYCENATLQYVAHTKDGKWEVCS